MQRRAKQVDDRARMPSILSALAVAAFVMIHPGSAFAAAGGWQQCLAQGDADIHQQNFVAAETQFRQAVKVVECIPHRSDDLTKCLNKLAAALAYQDKTDAAEATYERSLCTLEKAYGKHSPKLVQTLLALGSIYEAAGDHSSAMGLYNRALEISERRFGPFDPAVACGLSHLAPGGHDSNNAVGAERSKRLSFAALKQQPDLAASNQLLKQLGSYDRDLITDKEDSDQRLIEEFGKTLSKATAEANAYDRLLSNSPRADVTNLNGKM